MFGIAIQVKSFLKPVEVLENTRPTNSKKKNNLTKKKINKQKKTHTSLHAPNSTHPTKYPKLILKRPIQVNAHFVLNLRYMTTTEVSHEIK